MNPNDDDLSQLIRDKATRYQMPLDLLDTIQEQLPQDKPRPKYRMPAFMQTGLSFAAGIILTLLAVPLWQHQATSNEFTDSHVRSLLAEHLMDVVSTDQHTVKPWFLGKLDYAPPVHDLAADGYPLIGGRLDVIGGRDIAALVFRRNKHIINLFVFPEDRATNVGCQSAVGFQAIDWQGSGMRWCVVSDLNMAELQTFVKLQQTAG